MTSPGDEQRRTDEAWRSIVEHYGDRPALEPEPDPLPEVALPPFDEDLDDEPDEPAYDSERFVPPPPPPRPRPTPRRAAAWAGVFVAPILLLVLLVFGIGTPALVDLVLLGWFVGGFVYLVATMPRAPRDPWDDGSRV